MNEIISDLLALSVPCPLCNAPEDSPCVYVWPKGVRECEFKNDSDVCYLHSDSQHERLANVGTPTRVTHNARKQLMFNRRVRQRQLAELQHLRTWLLKYGDIFAVPGDS